MFVCESINHDDAWWWPSVQSSEGDSERLLKRSLHDAEEGLELRGDDCGAPPIWTDKLEETQYTISKYVIE